MDNEAPRGRLPQTTPERKGRPAPRTLGPVPDLERHLPAEWWRTLFNAVYLKTDGDVVENGDNTEAEIDLLVKAAGLEPNDRVLDLCCGQGRHAMALARRGFRSVTGIDRSRYLVRLARRRARELGLTIDFHEGDARRFRVAQGGFHCVTLMGNSFGYFESENDDLAVLQQVRRALAPNGTIAMDIADGDWMRGHFEKRSWEWIDENHFVCRERELSADRQRLITREVVVHAEKGVIVDQFYAERLYTREKLTELLTEAGFQNVRVHGDVSARSSREQDLGMMAHRFFVTASSPRLAAVQPAARAPFRNVAVLLGDPRLPDTVKLDGQFNELDLDTVQKLKDALAELPGFRFEFLDNHGALLTHLKNQQPEFVLNLCDEGFNNDAQMELHVAAYLEMLGVPYSGAGPATLGLCYNKSLVRAIAHDLDVPVPLETYADPDDMGASVPSVYPALIKPALGDSSLGITKHAVVNNASEAADYLKELRELFPGRPVLIQEFLSGAEYTVGLIGNPGQGLTPLPILEVDYRGLPDGLPHILSYESKWDPQSPYWERIAYREAHLDEDVRRALVDASVRLFERLDCRDYARFDFRADVNGTVKLLEVNPNPGWCWDGKLNLMAGLGRLRYSEMLRQIIEAAQSRCIQAAQPAAGRAAAE